MVLITHSHIINSEDFESHIIKTAQLEILEVIYKECQQGLSQDVISRIVFFDENEINLRIKELMSDGYVIKRNGKLLITNDGKNKRVQIRTELGRINNYKKHIGFV